MGFIPERLFDDVMMMMMPCDGNDLTTLPVVCPLHPLTIIPASIILIFGIADSETGPGVGPILIRHASVLACQPAVVLDSWFTLVSMLIMEA